MTLPNSSTKLNAIQMHLLELFANNPSEEDLLAIKKLLVSFYEKKVESEVESFWTKKSFSKDSWNKETRDIHLRSNKSLEE